ncbi:MAG: hemerythrin domain-containing protein, partial [Candidatus Bathyarchaeia archaeon]
GSLNNLTHTLENKVDNDPREATCLIDEIARKLLLHMLKEESVLFPILRRRLGAENPVVEMLSGHNEVKTAVNNLQAAVEGNDRQHVGGFARRLCRLKLSHMRKEDRVLFHLADALLDNQQKSEIARELASKRFHRRL